VDYVRLYFIYNHPPYFCYFCKKEMSLEEAMDAHIHHIDHNRKNNRLRNLSISHPMCHANYHGQQNARLYNSRDRVHYRQSVWKGVALDPEVDCIHMRGSHKCKMPAILGGKYCPWHI
jgi:hypothetical protein